MEKTLILLKPDTVQRGLIGNIVTRFEQKGLKIVAMKMMQMDNDVIAEHYSHIADKPFFPNIVKYMTMNPVVAMILEGTEAVQTVRNMCGATNPIESPMGTIRGDFALTIDFNVIHASDSVETANVEVERFFKAEEVFSYDKVTDAIV